VRDVCQVTGFRLQGAGCKLQGAGYPPKAGPPSAESLKLETCSLKSIYKINTGDKNELQGNKRVV